MDLPDASADRAGCARLGSCPICGMGLEPRVVTLGEKRSPALEEMTRRCWIPVALTAPILAFMIVDTMVVERP